MHATRLIELQPPDQVIPENATPAVATGRVGQSSPLGATVYPNGVNFSIFSRSASRIELLLFDHEDDAHPRTVPLDPYANRTYHYWHGFVPDLRPGQIYAYRAHGSFEPSNGLRFDPEKALLDPYGKGVVVPRTYSRETARKPGANLSSAMKSIVIDPGKYDWEGDRPLHISSARTIVYEMHVKGFTRHPNSGVSERARGTFAGLIEKVPYLKDLGITAVELLPIFQFDASDCPPGVVNYWGYQPVSFFSPHRAYSSRQDPQGPTDEFRDMVKALHRAGIEVILDVVFNHTSEGGHDGPALSFRGIDNAVYYILEEDRSRYADYSGCGNTLNANHPVVRRMILDSLRYWVSEMHVDGFRFDLASILSRDSSGECMATPPVLWDIESDPVLAGTKLIAEAWDAAGLYQVGNFIGDSWMEWNGRFRDDFRSFFRGENGTVSRIADRLVGSPAIYGHEQREAEQSVNFVTCHDGFTLNDLVSYNTKHNEANNDNNRDGANDNRSWNCGVEGLTSEARIKDLRNRQVKNFFTVTLLSLGLPMILMGDEVRHTQLGNNNNYCHDDESNWFDWSLIEKHQDIHRFVKLLISRRRLRSEEAQREQICLDRFIHQARTVWHGVKTFSPDWGDSSHSLAFEAELTGDNMRIYIILNAYWEPLQFELPAVKPGLSWRRWIDTTLDSPEDIVDWQDAPALSVKAYPAGPRSVVVLCSTVTE